MRYVERNPVRANFIDLAEEWQWGSAYARRGPADARHWLSIPDDQWTKSSALRLGLESTTRPKGRPIKETCPLLSSLVGAVRLDALLPQKEYLNASDLELLSLLSEHAGQALESAWNRAVAAKEPISRRVLEELVRA